MESGDGAGDSSLGESFLTNEPFVVGGTGDDGLVTVGDPDEETKVDEPLREQDRFLPIANVARIMKKSIPPNGKIAKDAKECVQECVSEFISFITSEASERCHQEKRKTINGEDILFAMSTLGFDNYVDPLKAYLQRYRESAKGDKAVNMNCTQESSIDEIGNEDAFSSTVTNMLSSDGTVQPGVILTQFPSTMSILPQ